MKKFVKKFSLEMFKWIVDISTIVALILQCLNINKDWVKYVAYFIIILSVISLALMAFSKKGEEYKKKIVVKTTCDMLRDATGKIVMFGGDLSWTKDYLEAITNATNNNLQVDIVFPKEKICNAKQSVMCRFENNIKKLKNAGANIYCTEKDYKLRCTIINADEKTDDIKIVSTKRVHRAKKNDENNIYKMDVLEYRRNRSLCDVFYTCYQLISQVWEKY